jgi:hypothetical protein
MHRCVKRFEAFACGRSSRAPPRLVYAPACPWIPRCASLALSQCSLKQKIHAFEIKKIYGDPRGRPCAPSSLPFDSLKQLRSVESRWWSRYACLDVSSHELIDRSRYARLDVCLNFHSARPPLRSPDEMLVAVDRAFSLRQQSPG